MTVRANQAYIYDLGVPDATDESSTLTIYVKTLLLSKIYNKTQTNHTTISTDY